MKSALAAINSEIKGLDAEMKLAVAQIDRMDDAEEKSARQSKVLEQQYAANEKKLSLLTSEYEKNQRKLDSLGDELERAKKEFGENSAEAAKLQNEYNRQSKVTTELNTAMTKTKTAMENAKNSMDKLGKETDETASAMEKGGEKTSRFGDVLKAQLTSTAIINGVKKLASALKDLAMGAVNLSDELATQASITGLSTDALQEYNYMAELVDVSVDTITGSLTKLTRNMQTAKKGTGTAADAFASLGISVTDVNGNLRSNQEVFGEVIDALGKLENETERDAIAMNIFGKSAQDLNPLIAAGSKQISAYAKEAHDMGYVMSSDVIAKNLEASDAYQRMQKSIEGAKNYIGSKFAPIIAQAAKTIMEMVQAAKENEGTIKTLASVIGVATAAFAAYKIAAAAAAAATAANPFVLAAAALTTLVAGIVLASQHFPKASAEVRKFAEEVDALTEDLNAQAEEWKSIEEARDAAISKGRSELNYHTQLYNELQTIVDENGRVKKGYEERARFITGELSKAFGVEIEYTGNVIKKYDDLKKQIDKLIETKKAQILINAQEQAYTQAIQNMDEATRKRVQAEEALKKARQEVVNNEAEIVKLEAEYAAERSRISQNGSTARMRDIEAEIEQRKLDKASLHETERAAIAAYSEAADKVAGYTYNIKQYEANLAAYHEEKFDKISSVNYDTAKSYTTMSTKEKAAIDAIHGDLAKQAADIAKESKKIGTNLIDGITTGVKDKTKQEAATKEVKAFSGKLLSTARAELKVKSPSRATAEIGRYLMEGFTVGINDEENSVLKQVRAASSSILGAFGGSVAPMTSRLTTVGGAPAIAGAGGTYVIQLMLDGRQIAASTTSIQSQQQRMMNQ